MSASPELPALPSASGPTAGEFLGDSQRHAMGQEIPEEYRIAPVDQSQVVPVETPTPDRPIVEATYLGSAPHPEDEAPLLRPVINPGSVFGFNPARTGGGKPSRPAPDTQPRPQRPAAINEPTPGGFAARASTDWHANTPTSGPRRFRNVVPTGQTGPGGGELYKKIVVEDDTNEKR